MGSRFEIWLTRDDGTRLRLVDDPRDFYYVRVVNNVGAFSLTLPPDWPKSFLKVDNRVEFWRAPEGGSLALDFVGFVRRWYWSTTRSGDSVLRVFGPDMNDLLARRIVAYAAGVSGSGVSGAADDSMKEIVDENLGGSAATARDITGAGFSVQVDAGDGPTLYMAFAWRNVLLVLQDIAYAAKTAGNEVFFDVVALDPPILQFQTWIDQRGMDRTVGAGIGPVIFGLEYGNLEQPSLEYDYSAEVTYAYAGGQGEGLARVVEEAEDTARSGSSLFNRRERFVNAVHCRLTLMVQDVADAAVAAGEPARRFNGALVDNEVHRYGRDWRFGDKVTVEYQGVQMDGVVRRIHLRVDEVGYETIEATVAAE